MNALSRMFSSLFLLTALLSSFIILHADWLFEQCTITDQFGNPVSLIDLQRKGEQMANEAQATTERIRSKDIVAESVYHGKMTLVEAAAFFRSLYEDPKSWHDPHRLRPDHDDGETWCREVIEWTVSIVRFEQSSSQADAVRTCLEMELQEQLDDSGNVKLPE